jgi:uncharacterized protein YacL
MEININNMKNIISKYPIIYLFLFCCGGLLLGLELSEIIKHGFPKDNVNLILDFSSIIFTAFLSFYFFYCFIKTKRTKPD